MKIMRMKVKQIIYLLVGLIIIYLIFYNRILRLRLPKELPTSFSFIIFIIVTVFWSLLLAQCFMLYKEFYTMPDNSNKLSRLLKPIIHKIIKHYYESLIHVKDFILEQITNENLIKNFQNKFLQICAWIYTYLPFYYVIYVCCNILPRILVSLTLLVDVFYFNRFNYVYKIMVILILPVIYACLSHIMKDLCTSYLISLSKYIIVTQAETTAPFTIKFTDKYNHLNTKENIWKIDYYFQRFTILATFVTYNEQLEKRMDANKKLHLFINICIRLCYCIAWTYILLHNNYILDYIPIFYDTIEPFSGIQIK